MSQLDLDPNLVSLVIILSVLEFTLKGFALWKAAQKSEKGWFIALFLLNTAGVLPLIYLYLHRKSRK